MDSSDHFTDIVLVASRRVRIIAYWPNNLWLAHYSCEAGKAIFLFDSLGFQTDGLCNDRAYHLDSIYVLTDCFGIRLLVLTLNFFFGSFKFFLDVFQFDLQPCLSLRLIYDGHFAHEDCSATVLFQR